MRRKHIKAKTFVFEYAMTLEEIEFELDRIWDELGYKSQEYPCEHSWRRDGVNSYMILRFCETHNLKCFIHHQGRKIQAYIPPDADSHTPVCNFSVWGDHAYWYGKPAEERGANNSSAANNAAAQLVTTGGPQHIPTKCVKRAFEVDNTPPFAEWGDEWQMHEDLCSNFEELVKTSKNLKCCKTLKYFWTHDITLALVRLRHLQTNRKGTPQCFGIKTHYGESAETPVAATVNVNERVKLKLRAVPKEAKLLQHICETATETLGLDPSA